MLIVFFRGRTAKQTKLDRLSSAGPTWWFTLKLPQANSIFLPRNQPPEHYKVIEVIRNANKSIASWLCTLHPTLRPALDWMAVANADRFLDIGRFDSETSRTISVVLYIINQNMFLYQPKP